MGFWGKDGTYYNTWDEMKRADVKWEQQDKQNRLIAEQNRLIRQQQERQEFQEELERRKIAYQQRYEEFEYKWQTEICPLLEEAKIKNPVKYLENLQELYNSKPDLVIPKIPKINSITEARNLISIISRNTDISKHIDEYRLIMKEIRKITAPLDKKRFLYTCITTIICSGILLVSCATGKDFFILLSLLIDLIVAIIIRYKYKKELAENPKLNKQTLINEINNFIDAKNIENRKEIEQWENKIKNYENKRLENFNYLLEIALEKLSIAESELENYNINYRLQFNDYPSDYDKKKNEYLNKKNLNQAKENGTEDFLDL